MSNKIIVGTRGSILALAQAEKVKQLIEDKYLELKKWRYEIVKNFWWS